MPAGHPVGAGVGTEVGARLGCSVGTGVGCSVGVPVGAQTSLPVTEPPLFKNIEVVVAPDVFQQRVWEKDDALWNIPNMYVARSTFHGDRSWLKSEASPNV